MFNSRLLYLFVLVSMVAGAPASDGTSSFTVAAVPHNVSATLSISSISPDKRTGSAQSSPVSSAPSYFATVLPASDALNNPVWPQDTTKIPEPINEALGATILTPDDVQLDRQNPDLFAPPTTDEGLIKNAKWPMALSSNKLYTGGWARQQ
ncbi:hypothetical protein M0805_008640, partial [Coniferiporia weirii]